MALGLLVALGVALASPAEAAEKALVEAFLTEDGGGELWAQETEREGHGWKWEACDVHLSSCVPYAAKGNEATTANAMPETIFRATSSAGLSAVSPVWHGNVRAVEPPTVHGEVQANQLVRPIPGRWNGGWAGDYDWMQLAACKTAIGEGCTTLTDMHYNGGCAHDAAVLDRAFTGYYLRVADRRVDRNAGIALYAISTPYAGELWEPGPLISVAMVGRIGPASGPRAAKCGPPPIVERAAILKSGEALISCVLGCKATLVAARRGRQVKAHSRVGAAGKTLRLSTRKLMHLGSGRARMVVFLDGKRAAHRSVHLP